MTEHTAPNDKVVSLGQERAQLLKLTTEITVAKVSGAYVAPDALPDLIRSIYDALLGSHGGERAKALAAQKKQHPAVPIKKSVYPDYIVCLEDGKKLKMLKRHLKSTYGLTPEQYREKWGLPSDYPMVAPSYAERRSALARNIGLGRNIGSTSEGRRGTQE